MSGPAVLIVDDDFDVRDSLVDVLSDAGYEVVTAGDGKEALEKIRGGLRPALIILDLMMPVMDGFQFRSEQKADPQLASIPVIILTADRRVDGKDLPIDADAYVAKPTRIDRLMDAVKRLAK
jgi:CheY-like chemotaxis protein